MVALAIIIQKRAINPFLFVMRFLAQFDRILGLKMPLKDPYYLLKLATVDLCSQFLE